MNRVESGQGYLRQVSAGPLCSFDASVGGKKKRDDHTLYCADALVKTGSENIEATMRRRWVMCAGFLARTTGERLPRKVIVGEYGRGYTGYTGGQE